MNKYIELQSNQHGGNILVNKDKISHVVCTVMGAAFVYLDSPKENALTLPLYHESYKKLKKILAEDVEE